MIRFVHHLSKHSLSKHSLASRGAMSSIMLCACLATTSCGGGGKKETPPSSDQTSISTTSTSTPENASDRKRIETIPLKAEDLTVALDATNPNRSNKATPQQTDFPGNPDIRAQRQECGVALDRANTDTASVTGDYFVIPDPTDAKTLSVGSQVNYSRTFEDAEAKLRHLTDPMTATCMQGVLQKRAAVERDKRNIDQSQLVANQTIEPIDLSSLGATSAGYRFHLTINLAGATSIDHYVDLLVTYLDRAEIVVAIDSSNQPPSKDLGFRLIERERGRGVKALRS